MAFGLQTKLLIFIICFLKACLLMDVKVVPNDIFKFGGESVNTREFIIRYTCWSRRWCWMKAMLT